MHQGQNIQVFVRCRPLNGHEKRSVVEVLSEDNEVRLLSTEANSHKSKNFNFDRVFASDAKQSDVYKTVVGPLIDQVLLGFNCTVFAYGQTGTGKTYTMEGDRSEQEYNWEEDPHSGIIPRAISQLFDTLKEYDNEFTVRVSFLELYNEDTYDLLSPICDTNRLKIFDDAQRKGSVIVGGLEEVIVQSKAEIYAILKRGSAKRQTAATLMNACSSRSHTIFSVTVHIREGSIEGEELLKIGKLNLVDLAGSENIGRSGAQDKRAREAGNINQSLLTLGRVITALVEKRPHVPYRESKLTRLLQDSLGGKTKTSIIATISPASLDLEDTLSTLEYASRAKKITNKPEMNQKLTKKALLREYTQEIERLRRDLQATREKNGIYIEEENYKDMCKQLSLGNTAIQEKEDRLQALQDEIEKKQKLFEDFTMHYEQTKAELEKANQRCEKQRLLIKAQREIEKRLILQASQLIEVAETASKDNHLLHGKKERIENILKENRSKMNLYLGEFTDDISQCESLFEFFSGELANISSTIHDKFKLYIESNADAIDQVTSSQRIQADQLRKQSCDIKESVNNIRIQSTNLSEKADHFRLLANECDAQSRSLLKDVDSLLKLSNELDKQATVLERCEPISNELIEKIAKFQSETEEGAGKLEQVASTLNSTMKRVIGSLKQNFDRFFTREIKEDVQTGLTPQKKVYDIPKRFDRASTCQDIVEGIEENELDTSGIV